ncbi:hypothetical protein ABEP17_04065 [Priestia flexa]|nr:hypothetical protein [Priestia flexa]MCM3066410.1 hypothetical protein [Priestia flexa]MED4589950.1 hypothetical protein [Priestia flexa]WHX77621.1 hypothetical protein QNH32_11770 [Priestia flexa]
MMTNQQENKKECLYKFHDFILVQCPSCQLCARITSVSHINGLHQCECSNCGYDDSASHKMELSFEFKEGFDPFFNLPLYLKTSCPNHLLWAYNLEHLQYIESYVKVGHPRHIPEPDLFHVYVPSWVTSSEDQKEALAKIEQLKFSVFHSEK